jgi:hypothetical protein
MQAWQHGLSLFGDLKYPVGFAHFDYVNPNAPKGGTVRQAAFGTYDNFNMVVAGGKGKLAVGLDLIYETLLTPSLDEASTEYGLLAEAVIIRGTSLPSPIVCVWKRNGTMGSRLRLRTSFSPSKHSRSTIRNSPLITAVSSKLRR